MIPDEAVRAAEMAALGRYLNKATVRLILEAAAPHMLQHFANRVDWRCSDCEEPIGPDAALKKLLE